jgi:hyaluronoglucosaminidase
MLNLHTASGWTPLGPVHDGYTAVSAATLNGAPVDAIRIAWEPGQQPTVNEVIPVYTGALPASINSPTAVAALPGSARRIDVTLTTATSGSINGTVSVQAPAGWAANAPTFSLASDNRLVTSRASLSISVPASAPVGTYPVRLVATDTQGHTASTQVQVNVVRPPTDTYARTIFADGPTAYWRLDEPAGTTALDASGSGVDGTYNGSVQLSQPGSPASLPDESVHLNGGYVSVPDNHALDLTGPFTLEAWVRPDHVAADPGDGIIEKYDSPAKNGYILRLAAGNRVQGWVLGANGYSYATGATALAPNTWHHLAVVYDGTSLTLYADGHLDGQTSASVAPTAGTGSLKLGARGDDAGQRLTGSLDEVAIYPVALTAEQIARHAAG